MLNYFNSIFKIAVSISNDESKMLKKRINVISIEFLAGVNNEKIIIKG